MRCLHLQLLSNFLIKASQHIFSYFNTLHNNLHKVFLDIFSNVCEFQTWSLSDTFPCER